MVTEETELLLGRVGRAAACLSWAMGTKEVMEGGWCSWVGGSSLPELGWAVVGDGGDGGRVVFLGGAAACLSCRSSSGHGSMQHYDHRGEDRTERGR